MPSQRFQNQHAIITGGSSGIGRSIACLLATEGAHITIIARDADRLAQAQADIEQARSRPSQHVQAFSADVSRRAEIEGALSAAMQGAGAPDVVITAAGIVENGLFRDLTPERFEQVMAVNYLGTLYAIKAVLPAMLARHSGHIVMLSSGAGLYGVYELSAYCASKFALHGLASSLRAELKPEGIGISVVYPPDTNTPGLAQERLTKSAEGRQISGTARTIEPEVVAGAIVDGIMRRAYTISPGLEMTVLARLNNLIEPLLNRYVDAVIAGVRGQREKNGR